MQLVGNGPGEKLAPGQDGDAGLRRQCRRRGWSAEPSIETRRRALRYVAI
jgi:hypothetical protein